jgi:hypothetical protein
MNFVHVQFVAQLPVDEAQSHDGKRANVLMA